MQKEPGKNVTHSQRASSKKETCPFVLVIQHEIDPSKKIDPATSGRWFINLQSEHKFNHRYHLPYKQHYRASRKIFVPPNAQLKLSSILQNHHYSAATFKALVDDKSNANVPIEVVRALRNQLLYKEANSSDETPAQQLLNHLKQREDIDYVFYTASRSRAGGKGASKALVRLKKQNKRGYENVETRDKEHLEGIELLLDCLELDDGQEVLVAVAWTSHKQKRYTILVL